MSAISRDVLANRRSHDTCDRGECFYPTVIQLAEEVEERERLVLDMGEQLQSMRHDYLRNMPRCECLSCMAIRSLLARLSRLGAGDSGGGAK